MTPEEAVKNFGKVVSDLKGQYNAEIMASLGVTALTLLKQRVTETGVDADGKKFPGYSTKPTLIGAKSFRNKKYATQVLGSKKKRAALEWKTLGGASQGAYADYLATSSGDNFGNLKRLAVLEGGYKELRRIQGAEVNFVDFIYTGRMWSNIKVVSKQSDHQRGIAIIGATTPDDKKKLEGNTKRKGDILDLSNKEQEQLKKSYGLSVLQIFKNDGL